MGIRARGIYRVRSAVGSASSLENHLMRKAARLMFIVSLVELGGCVTVPHCNPTGLAIYPCYEEDIALVRYWTEEFQEGLLSVDDYKFLIRGRLAVMP